MVRNTDFKVKVNRDFVLPTNLLTAANKGAIKFLKINEKLTECEWGALWKTRQT